MVCAVRKDTYIHNSLGFLSVFQQPLHPAFLILRMSLLQTKQLNLLPSTWTLYYAICLHWAQVSVFSGHVFSLMSHKTPFKNILKSPVVRRGCMRAGKPDFFRHILAGSLWACCFVLHPRVPCPHLWCGVTVPTMSAIIRYVQIKGEINSQYLLSAHAVLGIVFRTLCLESVNEIM